MTPLSRWCLPSVRWNCVPFRVTSAVPHARRPEPGAWSQESRPTGGDSSSAHTARVRVSPLARQPRLAQRPALRRGLPPPLVDRAASDRPARRAVCGAAARLGVRARRVVRRSATAAAAAAAAAAYARCARACRRRCLRLAGGARVTRGARGAAGAGAAGAATRVARAGDCAPGRPRAGARPVRAPARAYISPMSHLHLSYVPPTSRLHLAYISPTSRLHLAYISRISRRCAPRTRASSSAAPRLGMPSV